MKSFLLTLLTLLCSMSLSAQLTAAGAFTSAPAEVFPLLDKNTRLDMVDYFNSGLATPSTNKLQGRSAITELSPESLSVKISEASSAQIALLKAGNDTLIALVSTVSTPGLDSNLKFYDSGWRQLQSAKYFTAPGWDDWVTTGHDVTEVTAYSPFMLASYFIDPSAGVLTITNNLSTFIDEDTYKDISEALHPSLTYKWNGRKFMKQ